MGGKVSAEAKRIWYWHKGGREREIQRMRDKRAAVKKERPLSVTEVALACRRNRARRLIDHDSPIARLLGRKKPAATR